MPIPSSKNTIKDKLAKKVAEELQMSEEWVNIIISDAYENANKATQICNSVELSGLGTFLISAKKARDNKIKMERCIRKYTKDLETETSEQKIKTLQLKLKSAIDFLNYINSKLDVIQNS